MQMGEQLLAGDEDEGSSLQGEVNREFPGKIERSADALQIISDFSHKNIGSISITLPMVCDIS